MTLDEVSQLDKKIQKSYQIIKQAFEECQNLSLAWTGGKDSTAMLWLVRDFCRQSDKPLPKIVFINEGDPFDQILEFKDSLGELWQLNVTEVANWDVLEQAGNVGDRVVTKELNQQNQEALKEIGFDESEFRFEPESLVGNHLMKTIPLRNYLTENKIDGLFVGVRWDEHPARSKDEYFRKMTDPKHLRIEPILHFTEADIWQLIQHKQIPTVSLYEQGFRSLGVKSTTTKDSDLPAWQQDLKKTKERSGRRQDKEKIMKRLRDLGYM